MDHTIQENDFFGTERVSKILLKIAPPVMLAQLIQALYNIVDSYFVGSYSADALTALSVIFPIQLLIVALAVGTGVGVNTFMARLYAFQKKEDAEKTAGTGMVLSIITWAIFALISALLMRTYVMTSAKSPLAVEYAVTYGRIVCIGSLGIFLEGNWSKVHQAKGNMRLPMMAQIVGAVVNMILDPILIFGLGPIPEMGVAGAGLATVLGQVAAAVLTFKGGAYQPPKLDEIKEYIIEIYKLGYPSILMQALYTAYIILLNMILAGFSDAAVTVLGLYYKMQSFFFIPLLGLQTCIVPVLSYNFAQQSYKRCKKVLMESFLISTLFMILGFVSFVFFPNQLIELFSESAEVFAIGRIAFPIIGSSFFSATFSLIMPVFFQAIGNGKVSVLLSLTRQIFCLLPIFWAFSLIGLDYTWLSFPISETIAGALGLFFYYKQLKVWS